MKRKKTSARFGMLVVLCGAFGCSGCGPEPVARTLVAPGSYGFYNCAQLAYQEKAISNRNVGLERLMARTKEGPGGGVISAMTYNPEYESNKGLLYSIRETQREKNCTSTPAAPAALPAPSDKR